MRHRHVSSQRLERYKEKLARNRRVVMAYAEGVPITRIAELNRICEGTVRNILGTQDLIIDDPRVSVAAHEAREIVKAYRRGSSRAWILSVFGITNSALNRVLDKYEENARLPRPKPVPQERVRQALVLLRHLIPLNRVANIVHVKVNLLRTALREDGNDPSTVLKEARRERNAEYIKMYSTGMSTVEIGRQYGTSASAISNILIKHGVDMRTGDERRLMNEKRRLDIEESNIAKLGEVDISWDLPDIEEENDDYKDSLQ